MKKTLKIILSFFSILIILLVSIPIIVSMLLQVSFIQNFAVNQITKLLSEKAETTISISNINIEFFNRVVIDDVYIADPAGDTMINVKKLKVDIRGINFITGKISLGAVNVIEGQCRLQQDSMLVMNVQRVFDHFKPEVPPVDQPNFRMSVNEVNLINYDFSMKLYGAKKQKYGINFQDLAFSKVNFQARRFEIFNYDIWLAIEQMRFKDKSGFYLQHLSSPRCGVNDSGMRFEHLRIETPKTLLQMKHLYLLYDTWYAYNNFVEEVTLDADIQPSKFSYSTLAYFIQQPPSIPTTIQLEGRVRGPVPNLNGYLSSVKFGNTDMGINFSIVGLPDITQTKFNLQLSNLTTNASDIENIYKEITGNSLGGVNDILNRAGNIQVEGTFKGLLNDYTSQASITTNQGTLGGTLGVQAKLGERMQLKGQLNTAEFNIGALLNVAILKGVSFDANVDMLIQTGREPLLTANGVVNHLGLAGYDFKDISLNGKFIGKTYDGSVDCNDPNLVFHTTGNFDLRDKQPAYDFRMDLKRANLVALGLNKRDSISELSAQFSTNGIGDNIDNINGVTKIEHIVYINHIDTVRAGDIMIVSRNEEKLKQMKMTSQFADIDITGTNSYSQILTYLAQSAQKYIPSFPDAQQIIEQKYVDNKTNKNKKKQALPPTFNDGSYTIEVNVKKANNVASIFVPGLEIAQGSRLSFMFDPVADKFRLDMNSNYIRKEEDQLQNIVLTGRNSLDSVMFKLTSKTCDVAGLHMPNLDIRGRLKDNRIGLNVRFNNPEEHTSADIRTTTSIYRTEIDMPQIKVAFRPTVFSSKGNTWRIDSSYVLIDSTGFTINKFRTHSDDAYLAIDGKVGKSKRDSLMLQVEHIDISPLSMLVSSLGYNLSGHICGNATGVSLLNNLRFDALLNIHELHLNNHPLGDPCFRANWNTQQKRIDMSVSQDSIIKSDTPPLVGYFDVINNRYGLDVRFPNFDMALLEPLLQGILTNTSGQADVNLSLTSLNSKPLLNGKIDIKNYKIKVDYTKAEYNILPGQVVVTNNNFKALGLSLTDNLKGSGKADLYLNSKYFQNLSFGVNIRFTDLLALNTTVKDNSIFFGRAFGSGEFDIVGTERRTAMVINAQTALESEFNLPFNGISTIEDASFITFVAPNFQTEDTTKHSRSFLPSSARNTKGENELDIKINMNVLPNTKANIAMVNDYVSNSIMGVGNGNLRLHINPLQDVFTMNGAFEIVRGNYKFQMKSIIIDKQLSILPGGNITWSGDPADPMVNIEAVYKVKTSLDPLTGGSSMSQFGTNVNIDCGVNLVGKLFTPTLNLSVTAPSADPETQNFLRNYLNTQELITNQFFSLVLFRTFTPDMSTASVGSMGTSLASAAGFEFLSNQLSNLISNEKYRFRVGYRPRSENTSDEFSANFETDIIPNKLSIEVGGNYNTGNNNTYSQRAPFTGDAYVTYILNKAGNLKLKGFTRVIERFDETQGLQDTGIGLYLRQDFQTFNDLRAKLKASREAAIKRRQLKKEEKLKKSPAL